MTDPRRSLDPAKSVRLTKVEMEIARLTVEGYITEAMAREGNHREGWPLTLEEAARATGYRLKRARTYLDVLPEFNAYRQILISGRRESEQARNLARAIEIRDNPGRGLPADRTVQLKAIQAIEGKDKGPAVTVNVNQHANVASILPGYVIRLPASKAPAIEQELAP